MNKNFSPVPQRNYLYYKSKMPLFVINYECTRHTEMDYNKYKYIRLEAIKSIYITENLSTICRYADPRLSPFDVSDLYGCAVLIETYPEGKIPTEAGKGVRKHGLTDIVRSKSSTSRITPHFLPFPIIAVLFTGIPQLVRTRTAKPTSASTIIADAGN